MLMIRPRRASSLIKALRPGRHCGMQGAEVGVLEGDVSRALLRHLPELLLWMVDTWTPAAPDSAYRHSQDGAAMLSQEQHLTNLQRAFDQTAFAGNRRLLLRAESAVAALAIGTETLDFVFIDAEHTYEAVYRDISNWWPKLRPGGIMAGHDYGGRKNRRGIWGVNRAVDAAAGHHGVPVEVHPGRVWLMRNC